MDPRSFCRTKGIAKIRKCEVLDLFWVFLAFSFASTRRFAKQFCFRRPLGRNTLAADRPAHKYYLWPVQPKKSPKLTSSATARVDRYPLSRQHSFPTARALSSRTFYKSEFNRAKEEEHEEGNYFAQDDALSPMRAFLPQLAIGMNSIQTFVKTSISLKPAYLNLRTAPSTTTKTANPCFEYNNL